MPSKSKKQARFMRAVAHSKKFAKKVGVPQSVGKEFAAHDKRIGKYAGGGRVNKIRRLYEAAFATDGTPKEKATLERLLDENPGIDRIVDLYSLVKSTSKNRSSALINLEPEEYINVAGMSDNYRPIFDKEVRALGKKINSRNKMHTIPYLGVESSGHPDIVRSVDHDGRHRAQLIGDRGLKVPTMLAPNPMTAPSRTTQNLEELLKWLEDKRIRGGFRGAQEVPLKKRAFSNGGSVNSANFRSLTTPAYVDGGPVGDEPAGLEKLLKLSDQLASSGMSSPTAFSLDPATGGEAGLAHALLKAFSRNWAGMDEKGRLKMGKKPGIAKYTQGLPALAMDLSDVVLPRAPWAGKKRPEWSTRALEDAAEQEMRVDEVAPLTEGNPFVDSLADMLMQVPIPGRSAATGVQKMPKAMKAVTAPLRGVAEYIGPTVEPKPGAYALGAVSGGVMGSIGDDSELEALMAEFEGEPEVVPGGFRDKMKNFDSRQFFADGGRVRRTARAMKAIKEAIAHIDNNDRASALRSLTSRDIDNDPGIEEVRRLLKGPAPAGQAKKNLDKAVEEDTNTRDIPLLGG